MVGVAVAVLGGMMIDEVRKRAMPPSDATGRLLEREAWAQRLRAATSSGRGGRSGSEE